ncbi:MAG: hypothetical protein HQL39_08745 [Alphaproteobacteria bacterium]|nr:hypothetical protein [Alphaproteobacteria bacterium]
MKKPGKAINWLAAVVSLMWIGLVGWERYDAMSDPVTIGTSRFNQQFDNCQGSFRRRSDCGLQLMLKNNNETFLRGAEAVAIVFLPPLLGWIFVPKALNWINTRNRPKKAAR